MHLMLRMQTSVMTNTRDKIQSAEVEQQIANRYSCAKEH